jgi:MerR family transcriptional regulator, copper efflux regulator
MPTDLPIACSLSADELPARLAEMAAVGRTALDAAEVDGRRAVLRFRTVGDTRERLASIVAAEQQCCAFLDLRLLDEPGMVVLTVDAPEGAETVLAELVGAFRGDA